MAVNLQAPTQLLPIAGVEVGTVCAGIKQNIRPDVTLFRFAAGTHCVATFTRNAFCAAPVILARQHLATHAPRYWLINSGNANAGTGADGMNAAMACCHALAQQVDCETAAVLPFSTGVIGQALPVAKITAALPAALAHLRPDAWLEAAQAIMTTDTLAKGLSVQTEINGTLVTVTGIAKGSGMIRPDMATMLAFIATDAAVSADILRLCFTQAVEGSFNRISVDGDTSTNDACVLAATGQAGNTCIDTAHSLAYTQLHHAITTVCQHLAQAIVRDGEGATKFITIALEEGEGEQECLDVAYTIAHSPLIKTAFFASDPNWGRILAAVGRAGLVQLDLEKIRIYLDNVCIVRNGGCAPEYTEAQGQAVMAQAEITIRVCLGRGQAKATVWTCDFSYDYVKINAEYRT
jgi:glutamate N-acetyltransferase / amino-acid N-acetyltransferase